MSVGSTKIYKFKFENHQDNMNYPDGVRVSVKMEGGTTVETPTWNRYNTTLTCPIPNHGSNTIDYNTAQSAEAAAKFIASYHFSSYGCLAKNISNPREVADGELIN